MLKYWKEGRSYCILTPFHAFLPLLVTKIDEW